MAKRIEREISQVKPSELKKDITRNVRLNSYMLEKLKSKGYSVQSLFDEALNKKLGKVEYEQKLTIEVKEVKKTK